MTDEVHPTTTAEAFLAALKTREVDWIFGNAGTDFAPLIEAVAAADAAGSPVPRAVEVIHETVAVAMAHGYYLMTGRPQCVMVHVNVGVANSLMGLINASRANIPMLFASGRTPITEQGRLGSRNMPIHWGQEMFDQGGMLREFVKWDNELRAPEQVVDVVDRALAITRSEPKGPVYLSLPREVLAAPLPDDFTMSAEPSVAAATPPAPDQDAINQVVALLSEAEQPLIITSDGGEALFSVLGDFALEFAVPVVQFWRTSPAIATTHPMYAGEVPVPLLAESDLVIVLDSLVPWMPDRMDIRDNATVVNIGPDPLFTGTPIRSFPSQLTINATPSGAIDAVGTELRAIGHSDSPDIAARRDRLTEELNARRTRELAAGANPGGSPMSPEYMTRVLGDAAGSDATIVNELGLATAMLDLTRHDSFLGLAISGGLGWGGGAAVGAKLADPDRLVIWATGDGSYVFSNPLAVHHAAASLGLGLITVVADNRVWNAVRRSTIAVYPDGRAAASETMPLSSLEPAPDYTKFVEAYGGHGEHVTDPDLLRPALDRAIDIAKTGRQALVSVHVSYPDMANH
jgi:acetolactate synthase-1/2/3 large subunit